MLALPVLNSRPTSVRATSLTRIGSPPRVETTMLPISLIFSIRPPARTTIPSPLRSMKLALRLTLLASIAFATSSNVMP